MSTHLSREQAMTDFKATADLLTRLNRWRRGGRGEMPDPREITAAINTAIQALKIAEAAREWRDAELAKAAAKRRFADAVSACIDHVASWRAEAHGEPETVWHVHRMPFESENGWVLRWMDQDGSDASDDPRAIENQAAHQALREARKAAGIKRATLTRMIGRLTK